ncbi:MAG TPA: alkane 1-monooxygenase [Steroidobacteraceae bacterium]|nr:alkane 1-monooxygenase [Steroidobacteraceae bacterium]
MLLRRLGFMLPLLLPPLVLAGYRLGGSWNFLVVGWVFVVLPLADLIAGTDTGTVAPRGRTPPGWRIYFDALLIAWVPVQLGLLLFGVAVFTSIDSTLGRVGFALSVGIVTGGVGIVVAHELGHRLGRLERTLACVLLASVGYMHFYIEHNKGHHARVATDEDPATARPGESFWHFLPRTVYCGVASAWQLEGARLSAAGLGSLDPRNRMLWAFALPLAAALLAGLSAGAPAAAFFVVQALVAITLLELVNYLEHYGLRRRRAGDGRYERVGQQHSWNSSHRLSNWMTFNLQRHSHHHAQVRHHYQELEHAPAAPQLPAGYAGMVLLALVPPLWRSVMDPRLAAWQQLHGAGP